MHPASPVLAAPISQPKHTPRPVASFAPSPWGDRFLNYTPPDPKLIEFQKEIAKQLKEEIGRELCCIGGKPIIEQLSLIDSIEQLGVFYHFEAEIDDALLHIYESSIEPYSGDLFLTSLRFRLLRQHGFQVSSGLFKEYMDSNKSLKKEVTEDIKGILSMYEACYVRTHGDKELEKVLPQAVSILNKAISEKQSDTFTEECIKHALQKPLHKRVTRFECVRYMEVYEKYNPLHNKSLLKFAKLDFNLLQGLHKEELRDVCRYWKQIDFPRKLPLRDRMVEGHAWTLAGYYEPQYSIGRKITCIGGHIGTSIDDIYDAYATLDEVEIFTKAIYRWDKSCLEELPEKLRWFYKTLVLDAHEEIERLLEPIGRSHYVHYAKKEVKAVCKGYLTEARWRHNKYVPTLDEYMQNDLYRNTGYVTAMVYFLIGLDTATDRDFLWLCSLPNPVKAVCYQLRILNDVGGNKFDENRGLSSLFIECYMKEYHLSYAEACKELYMKVEESWKNVNEGMVKSSKVEASVYKLVVKMGRAVEALYNGGEDGYTLVNRNLKQIIKNMHIDPVVM